MAKQHFYARVPAKISMFNRADGMDTFACSEGITREFIESNLAQVYDIKIKKEELALIRDGKLPPVYFQFKSKDGSFVQSCLTLLPKDFTGERCAHLVHSLVLSEEEKHNLIGCNDYKMLNTEMFQKDLLFYDMLSPQSTSDDNYPLATYRYAKNDAPSELLDMMDNAMLRRVIYAMLSTACKKMKAVYFSIPDETDTSWAVTTFFNKLIQIFPYHMRGFLPFVSYVSEYSKCAFATVKGIPSLAVEIPSAKGAYFNFVARFHSGVNDDNVASQHRVVNFLSELVTDDILRAEFVKFCDDAVKRKPDLAVPTLQNVDDLVFLFMQGCGHFEEHTIIPNDTKVYEFFCAYDKNKIALSDEFRVMAMKCLQRYPNTHTAIPSNVFSKTSKLYPSEVLPVKYTVMGIVLDLMHTNVMRDKIFKFVSANYPTEEASSKALINQHFIRVFYGGFLQTQLIAFFGKNFKEEPEETRDIIVEKFSLAIRTQAIQQHILQFFSSYYTILTPKQKEILYATYFAMLPEGDNLAVCLTQIIDTNIRTEPQEFIAEYKEKLLDYIELEQKKKEHKGFFVLMANAPFCVADIVYKIFTQWSSRKIFTEYIAFICTLELEKMVDCFCDIWRSVPYMDKVIATKFACEVKNSFRLNSKTNQLLSLIDVKEKLVSTLCTGVQSTSELFARTIIDDIINPEIAVHINDVFKEDNGIDYMITYTKINPEIVHDSHYHDVALYLEFEEMAKRHERVGMVKAACQFSKIKSLRKDIACTIAKRFFDKDASLKIEDFSTLALIKILHGVLFSETFAFLSVYNDLLVLLDRHSSLASQEEKAMQYILENAKVLKDFFEDDMLSPKMIADDAEVWLLMKTYLETCDKVERKTFIALVKESTGADKIILEKSEKIHKAETKNNFFSRLFSRK